VFVSLSTLLLADDVSMSSVPATVAGILLVIIGGLLYYWQRRGKERWSCEPSLTDEDLKGLNRQYRRRVQVSGLLILIGLLIPLGDWGIGWEKDDALIATIFWLAVLGLTMWVMLLAIGDMLATGTRSRLAMSRLKRKQLELEQEAPRLRAASREGESGR